ncbi:helix-turn-helix transcriptional regulator [Bacteroides sp. 14(A)]|uniref:helix-turn-helix transcriptional regulator n=1 Tax=Bacteroides sp. 14(A) TaxID=1163670 RepID=UPI0018CC3B0D|nr:helix-turn-helix domain-containing protein [Bacteroides sp. 14(A)]
MSGKRICITFAKKRQYFAPMDYSIIKERRMLLGLTQQDLADYTGLSLRIIKSIEAGKGNPSVATLSKIAATLGLELLLRVKEAVR